MARRPRVAPVGQPRRVAPHPDRLDEPLVVYGDLTVPWSAHLVQPDEVQAGSNQPIIVTVTAPVILEDRYRVTFHLNRAGGVEDVPATWLDEPGQTRSATAAWTVHGAGARGVVVSVEVPGQQPRLRAGVIRCR